MGGCEIIGLQGGVNEQGKPFVHILADGDKVGQLTPGDAIKFGVRGIQAAIEAERDAGVVRAIHKNYGTGDEPEKMIASLLTMIREERDQWDPDGGTLRGPQ